MVDFKKGLNKLGIIRIDKGKLDTIFKIIFIIIFCIDIFLSGYLIGRQAKSHKIEAINKDMKNSINTNVHSF